MTRQKTLRRHLREPEIAEVLEWYAAGYSAPWIAERYRQPAHRIYRLLRARGVPMRPGGAYGGNRYV